MLCTQPITTKQNTDNKFVIQTCIYMGPVLLGYITANIFGKRKNPAPYIFTWSVVFGQPEPVIYCNSIAEGIEFVTEEFRCFLQSVLL